MDNEIKDRILKKIEEKSSVFIKISNIQYRIRCPLCGDTDKDLSHSHMYLKVSQDPSEPMLYKCFLCNSGGRVGKKFLEKMGIDPDGFDGIDSQIFNKISSVKGTNIDILTGSPIMDSKQVGYIQKRLGVGLEYEDYDRFKIIWNMSAIYPYVSNTRIRNTLPGNHNSISFLSDDKSTLLTRFFDDNEGRWKKTSLFNSGGRSFYTIKTTLDLFTEKTINVNIAEGVIDVISIYKNFNDGDTSVFIGALGSDYENALQYAISKGLVGSNVVIKIYIDSEIDEKQLKYKLRKYKWVFSSISIYKNIKFKDVGTSIDKIKLIEYKL